MRGAEVDADPHPARGSDAGWRFMVEADRRQTRTAAAEQAGGEARACHVPVRSSTRPAARDRPRRSGRRSGILFRAVAVARYRRPCPALDQRAIPSPPRSQTPPNLENSEPPAQPRGNRHKTRPRHGRWERGRLARHADADHDVAEGRRDQNDARCSARRSASTSPVRTGLTS